MKISSLLADDAILLESGERLARRRLDLCLTQAEVAEKAGVAKRTLERVEAGASVQMLTFIRIMRALDLLSGLEQLIPAAEPRPMDLLKRRGRQRQRAPGNRYRRDSVEEPGGIAEPWSWDDKG